MVRPGVKSLTSAILGVAGDVAVLLLCFPCIGCLICFGGRRGTCVRHHPPQRYPRHPSSPPKPRIDIRRLPQAEQPQSCRLLRLPLEVRQCIYEQVLGGRIVYLHFIAFYKVRAACYQPVDYPSVNPQKLDVLVDPLDTTLLRCCRKLYVEAQPILLQRNIFYFPVHQLEMIVLTGLGTHCLPDIRSVYLYHNYRSTQFVPPWAAVFPLLQRMHFTHLMFEFKLDTRIPLIQWFNSYIDILEGTWAQGVLGIRNLYQFGLFFKDGDGPAEDLVCRKHIAEELRHLMVGTGADERYRNFLEKRGATR
ncbi:hypothetical protein B0H19DRAFT_1258248 [Mycena capillaripes]|nr:hypothetical protein B0H19DRAFT_1258248 [Mycena capillaripes]